MNQPFEMAFAKTVHCLEVLDAVQQDSRTSGWYWGDARGKAAVYTDISRGVDKQLWILEAHLHR